jgi:hypothetical protein
MCKARGIILHNAAGYAVHAVSELAVDLMLLSCGRSSLWTRSSALVVAIWLAMNYSARPLGVIGCGDIGLQVDRLGNAFGCHVLGFEHGVLRIDKVAIEQVELDELLRRSDIVSLHVTLTPETRGFIGREQLARMKRSAILWIIIGEFSYEVLEKQGAIRSDPGIRRRPTLSISGIEIRSLTRSPLPPLRWRRWSLRRTESRLVESGRPKIHNSVGSVIF